MFKFLDLLAHLALVYLYVDANLRLKRLERRFEVPTLKAPKRQHTDPEDMLGDIPTYGRPVHGPVIRGTASCSKCGRRHDVESRCL